MTMLAGFRTWFEGQEERIVAWRRDLHAHPELGFEEHRTSAFVASRLREAGLEVEEGIAGTGIVATLPGRDERAIGFRADMDALPIAERGDRPHASRHPGIMHACGHDGHTTALLTAACFLAEAARREPPARTIRFVFQPAEENLGGARAMIEAGLLQRFPMEEIFALHNFPGVDLGTFMVRRGSMLAGFYTFDIDVRGESSHAALPARDGDTVVAAAALVTQLQTIVARDIGATDQAVLAVTRLHGGSAYNILPDQVSLAGSLRWFEAEVRQTVRRRMEQVCEGVGMTYGVRIDLRHADGYPPVVNAPTATIVAEAAACAVDSGPVVTAFAPVTGSEDFAFMLGECAGAYVLFGNGPMASGCGLHGTGYDFNDDALVHAAGFWVALASGSGVAGN